MTRLLVATAVFVGIPAPPTPAAATPIVRFTKISVEDGLPQSSVLSIVQDHWGFVWLGTQEGLSRYDGYSFTTWRAEPGPGFLDDDQIYRLALDDTGHLWVGTGVGLNHLDTGSGRVTRLEAQESPWGRTLALIPGAGRIWFAPERGGLWEIEGSGDAEERAVRRLEHPQLPPDVPVTALAATEATLWVASGGRLLEIDPRGARGVRVRRADVGAVSVLAAGPDGEVWVGREDGGVLARFEPETDRLDLFPQVPRYVLALLPDGPGIVWVGARAGGLSRLDAASGAVVTGRADPSELGGLSEDDVAALFRDRSGHLWAGTWNGGVSRLDPHSQTLVTLEHRPYVPDSVVPDVVALAEAADGRLWVASRNQEVAVGDPVSGRFQKLEQAPLARVRWMVAAGGLVYAATDAGLYCLDSADGTRRPLPAALARRGLGSARVDAIAAEPDGTLWIARGASLLEARGRDGSSAVREWALPVRAPVSALFATPMRVWVGTETGELASLDRTDADEAVVRPEALRVLDGVVERRLRITALFADAAALWVGTRAGVARIDIESGRQSWLDRSDGLPSAMVAGLLGDAAGGIWLATNRGLTRVQGGAVLHLGTHEGAQGSGYAEGAFARGASGRLYFAGSGITIFDPSLVTFDTTPPVPVLTGLAISHERVRSRWLDSSSPLATQVHAAQDLSLGPGPEPLAIEFAGLHFGDPASHRYAYRLEGVDEHWIETDAGHRVAAYTGLAPGDYRLRVRAATKHSPWSRREAALRIHVLPHWWQTWWARWGAVLVAGLGGAAVLKLRVRRLERERERLARVVAERTAELEVSNRERRQAEVSAALQSLVAGIAHEVRNPLFALSASVDALCVHDASDSDTQQLQAALHQQVARLKGLTDRLLEYGAVRESRLELLQLQEVVFEAWERCRADAAERQVELVTRFEDDLPLVEADRPSLAQSLENLLGNAVHFAPRGSVVLVSASREVDEVALHIEDSGAGIAPGDEQRVFAPFFTTRSGASGLGLSLAKRFVESHGGRLTAGNRSGAGGARFGVHLPLPRP